MLPFTVCGLESAVHTMQTERLSAMIWQSAKANFLNKIPCFSITVTNCINKIIGASSIFKLINVCDRRADFCSPPYKLLNAIPLLMATKSWKTFDRNEVNSDVCMFVCWLLGRLC
jgi:hypothetical protein